MFAYCNNNPATYLDPTGTRIAFWHQLFEDHDPGYLHRVVQADIFVKHNLQAVLYDTEYVMPGIGRADVVCLSTGEMWEIKYGGSNATGWEKGLADANAQLGRYAGKGSALRKGRANMFSGSVVVGFGDMQYIVHYETPEVGVILYTLERKYEYESQVAYRYAPHTLYDYKKQLMGSFGIMLGLGVLGALHVNLQENTRGVGWR